MNVEQATKVVVDAPVGVIPLAFDDNERDRFMAMCLDVHEHAMAAFDAIETNSVSYEEAMRVLAMVEVSKMVLDRVAEKIIVNRDRAARRKRVRAA